MLPEAFVTGPGPPFSGGARSNPGPSHQPEKSGAGVAFSCATAGTASSAINAKTVRYRSALIDQDSNENGPERYPIPARVSCNKQPYYAGLAFAPLSER